MVKAWEIVLVVAVLSYLVLSSARTTEEFLRECEASGRSTYECEEQSMEVSWP